VETMHGNQAQVQIGVERAGEVQALLQTISTTITEINELNIQIANAAEHQVNRRASFCAPELNFLLEIFGVILYKYPVIYESSFDT
jgi:hypothetical protein